MMQKYGYGGAYLSENWFAKPVFIQAFATTTLQKARQFTDMPLVFLYEGFTARTQDTNVVRCFCPDEAVCLWCRFCSLVINSKQELVGFLVASAVL